MARAKRNTHKDAVRFDAVEAYRRNGRSITDRESATRVAMGDDMIAKGFCIVGQECSRYDSDKKGRTGRTEYLYK